MMPNSAKQRNIIPPSKLLQTKTRFFSIAYIGALC